jgi:hypothetical protein
MNGPGIHIPYPDHHLSLIATKCMAYAGSIFFVKVKYQPIGLYDIIVCALHGSQALKSYVQYDSFSTNVGNPFSIENGRSYYVN